MPVLDRKHLCPGGGGSSAAKFYPGKLRPEVQLLTFLYIFFKRKGTPPPLKQYLPLTNGTPFKYLVTFNYCNCTVFTL